MVVLNGNVRNKILMHEEQLENEIGHNILVRSALEAYFCVCHFYGGHIVESSLI